MIKVVDLEAWASVMNSRQSHLIALFCAAVSVWMFTTKGTPDWLVSNSNVAGALFGVVAILQTVFQAMHSRRRGDAVLEDLEILASATLDYWRRRAKERNINTPAAVTLRWRWADSEKAPMSSELHITDPTDGTTSDLRERLLEPLGRLIILGEPGIGKTTAMMLLLIDVLNKRTSGGPVPLWLTMGSWNPRTQKFDDWVISTLAETCGHAIARELWRTGRIAPFLDGLDEMPPQLAGQALTEIDRTAGDAPIVLTSGVDDYIKALDDGRLWDAAVVEIQPVGEQDVRDFLLAQQVGNRRKAWQQVINKRVADFDSPLILNLAREAYRHTDPRVLMDTYPTREALLYHLLQHSLVTAYPEHRARSRATRWLARIAGDLGGARDLHWWRLPTLFAANSPQLRWCMDLIAAVLVIVLIELAFGISFSIATGSRVDLVSPLVFAIPPAVMAALLTDVSLSVGAPMPARFSARPSRQGLISLGKMAGVGTVLGTVSLVVSRSSTQQWWTVLVAGVFPCILLLPSIAVSYETGICGPQREYRADRRRLFAVTAYGGILGAVFVGVPLAHRFASPWHPPDALTVNVFGALSGGIFLAVIFSLFFGFGPVLLLGILELAMLLRGTPLWLMRLLRKAQEKQVLRQAGTVYQFRHGALQDLLVQQSDLIPKHVHPID